MKRLFMFICILACSIIWISCSTDDNKTSQPEQQTITGYLFLEGNTLKVDEFEFITSADKERVKELKLSDADMPNGYYIHNESEDLTSYTLDESTQYIFYDTSNLFVKEEDDKKYATTSRQEFELFLYRGKDVPLHTPFRMVVQGNKVISVTEIFVN